MFRTIFIYTILFIIPAVSFSKEIYEADFNSGVKHFKKKEYKSALVYFKKAHSSGMKKSVLYFNIAVTYYKLGSYASAEKNFKHLIKDKKFRQIAFYNLGLIEEKRKNKKTAISWYQKTVSNNNNKNITQLANEKLDTLLKRKTTGKNKTQANISLAIGSDDNVTSASDQSPSNKSDTYLELFASIKTAINPKMNVKGALYRAKYNTLSAENFNFYSLGINYLLNTKYWKIIPEISLTKSTLGNANYQNIIDYKLTGKRNLANNSRLLLRYRYSDINSQNTFYNYLEGQRHQLRVDLKKKIDLGRLRLRYQLETNNRQNTLLENYSPTRHIFRARLKHRINNAWNLSEELAYRISNYDTAAGISRKDTRLRLRVIASKKIEKEWYAGVRYTYTDNNSNVSAEKYSRNNIQLFSNWDF